MNDLSAFDILLYGALSGVVLVAVGAALWALAYQGRKRWSAGRSSTPYAGHGLPRPTPHSFEAMTAGWLAFSDATRQAYGSFERYAQHLNDDPNRSIDNPIPQPTVRRQPYKA